ncbi:MAG TPA: hypothetical protein VMY59_02285, partial [Candidatus Thermoplasmatota archaeon]|nr:hypothetical protein [Candidatus Thermoplasmatota archaeon]
KMPSIYKELFHYTADYVRITEAPESWFARARTGRKETPEAFSGIHAPAVMAVADESSGVPDIIYEYGKGIATAPFWLFLMFSNPTRLTGYFHNAFDEEIIDESGDNISNKRKSEWRQYTFKSTDSPVVDWGFVEEKRLDSGYDSDDYRVFVLGEFPKADAMDDQGYVPLLTRADLEGAFIDNPRIPVTALGVDPSGEGHDKTAFVGKNQFAAKIIGEEKISTPKSVAAKTATFISLYGVKPQRTIVDNFGEGANVGKELALQGFDVKAINVGNKASDDKFLNKRAELTWKMREWIKRGGQLVRDDRWKELLNLRYRYNESGRLQIMGKEKMRKEGIPSPNFADAFMLTFAVNDRFAEQKNRSAPKNHDPYE